jgi:hypothetical protein
MDARKLIVGSGLLVMLLATAGSWFIAPAQYTPAVAINFVTADPAGACTVNVPLQYNTTNGKIWGCTASVWTLVTGSGAGTTYDVGTTGVYKLGATLGISNIGGGTIIAFGNGTLNNAQVNTAANGYLNTNANTGLVFSVFAGNDACTEMTGVYRQCIDTAGVRINSGLMYGFAAGLVASGANDTGIERIAAGTIGLNNGTSNTGGNLQIPTIKSTTGQRFVCVTTAGLLVSSAAACSGT